MPPRPIIFAIIGALLLPALARLAAADAPDREARIKAAFIFNFAQFVEWPAGAFADDSAPLVIGIVGQDSLDGALDEMVNGKVLRGRQIVVRHLKRDDRLSDCQLLFISRFEDEHLGEIFKQLGSGPVLTVGETRGFPWAGGTIRFMVEDNRLRFEINPDAAEKAGLKISAKLMKLARVFQK